MSQGLAVSVVVPTHNRSLHLEALLAGLRAQTLPSNRFEVIVVDDGSADATPAVLERERARGQLSLQTFRHDTPRGPAAARNSGWRAAGAPVIAFTDDDCLPTRQWLENLLARMGTGDDTIVTGPTVPNPAEAHLLNPYAKTVNITRRSPHYETCNVAYPRSMLEKIGGFDELYPSPAGEDSDLGCRAIAAGGRPLFAADAVVHHAVFARGPLQAVKDALLATDGVQAYKRNPELRVHLAKGIFYDRSHPMLLQAAVGVWLARRHPKALAMAFPYALNLYRRCRGPRTSARQVPFFLLFDLVQTAATIRGAVRHRLFVL